MVRAIALALLCGCAAGKPATSSTPVGAEECEREYERCNNGCFAAPHYKRNRPPCAQLSNAQLCPQEHQPVDTVAAGKCFERCEQKAQACRAPAPPSP